MASDVHDMRFCDWERETLPVDHDCIGSGSEMPPPTPTTEVPVTHIDDLGEPTTPYMEEPEPEPPLDLDEIETAYEEAMGKSMVIAPATLKALGAVPDLVAELREARSRIGALSLIESAQFTVTRSPEVVPHADSDLADADTVEEAHDDGRAVWVRTVSYSDWQLTSAEAPF
ncbi:hypothetical protein GT755_12235 [Herbidospora sp. NEAU-GS84]|uniref:Uncharacterized protein n=1 Tax=Herbidospora solisilvae TaxID=2696284 RepID=A0A7C9MZW9_9ACTN|nr:hypothetical protein [Herbidospora solisilvae]NAS22450.1 hypothetical protein [Herbidospora solisilvae]